MFKKDKERFLMRTLLFLAFKKSFNNFNNDLVLNLIVLYLKRLLYFSIVLSQFLSACLSKFVVYA